MVTNLYRALARECIATRRDGAQLPLKGLPDDKVIQTISRDRRTRDRPGDLHGL